MRTTLLATAIATSLMVTAPSALAGDDWKSESKDAWIDGKAEATLLFNGNLDSFDINTDVKDGVVTLTGKVDSSVDKDLAEELVLGIDGVEDVENMLTIIDKDSGENSISAEFVDRKIATVITSRFLFDGDLSAVDIDIEVEDGEVTLEGYVDSDAEKDLAEQIAKNTTDVKTVHNELEVSDSE